VEDFFDRESYPVSHGNWTSRWKTSITDERIRFTINGSEGIIDIDAEHTLELNKWTHVVALYNGMDCLVFLNGELNGFKPYSGTINKTSYDLVFGQSLPDQEGFNYRGRMDMLRLYNYGISYEQVKQIYESEISSVGGINDRSELLEAYPNPTSSHFGVRYKAAPNAEIRILLFDVSGNQLRTIETISNPNGDVSLEINTDDLKAGIYFVSLYDGEKVISKKVVKID
jgi:hypothetical protein